MKQDKLQHVDSDILRFDDKLNILLDEKRFAEIAVKLKN